MFVVAVAFIGVSALGVWVYTVSLMMRDREFGDGVFYALAILEVLLIAQLIGGCIALSQTSRDINEVVFVSYLVGIALIPVVCVVWGWWIEDGDGSHLEFFASISTLVVSMMSLPVLDMWAGIYDWRW